MSGLRRTVTWSAPNNAEPPQYFGGATLSRRDTTELPPGSDWVYSYGSAANTPQIASPSITSPDLASPQLAELSDVTAVADTPAKRPKKVFTCHEPGPHRTRKFANIHDLERHQRIHGIKPMHSQANFYICPIADCRNKDKLWDRKDNFRSHLVRRHFQGISNESNKAQVDQLVAEYVQSCVLY